MISAIMSACTTKVQEQPYQEYVEITSAGDSAFASVDDLPGLAGFAKMMREFSPDRMADNVEAAYASTFYFNDTFHSFRNRAPLIEYFTGLAGKGTTEVTFLDATNSASDYYVRWQMRMRFSVLWRDVDVTSVGLTHLRLNEKGKIIMQQDFWDSAEGFYAHLPVVGGQIESIRSRLGKSE